MAVSSGSTRPGSSRRGRDDEGGLLEGSWVWIALPVGILVLIAALWFLIIAPAGSPPPKVTVTPMGTSTLWPTVTPMLIVEPTQTPSGEATPTRPRSVEVGARVVVAGTGEAQLRIRQAPGTDTVTVKVVPDGTQLVVIGGPEQASGYTWWKVEDPAGIVGWVAGDFLTPAP